MGTHSCKSTWVPSVPTPLYRTVCATASSPCCLLRHSTGNKVTASVDTIYPFSDSLTTTIHADKAFTHYVRIPSWISNGTIAVNGGAAQPVSPSNGLQAVPVSAGTTTFALNLPSEITIGASTRALRGSL